MQNRVKLFAGGKVTVLGDSVPKGLYLENGKVMRVHRSAVDLLAERYGIAVDNVSAFGQTLKKCAEKGLIDRWLGEAAPEDSLVLSLGGNDCDYDWAEVAKAPLAPHAPKTPYPEFVRLLSAVCAKLRRAGHTPVFTSLAPIDARRYFEEVICRRADGERVMQFFCGDLSNITRHQEAYNAAVCRTALTEGVLLDFRTPLLLRPDCRSLLSDDGIHPNARGHEEIAGILGRAIAAMRRAV